MTEQRNEPLDASIREALGIANDGHSPPSFDETWAAAERKASGEAVPRSESTGPDAMARRNATRWAGLAAAVAALTVALILHDLRAPDSPATATSPRPEARSTAPAATLPAQPVIWYAPTDTLLDVTSLGYTARPAALTYYDPIHLEVRP